VYAGSREAEFFFERNFITSNSHSFLGRYALTKEKNVMQFLDRVQTTMNKPQATNVRRWKKRSPREDHAAAGKTGCASIPGVNNS